MDKSHFILHANCIPVKGSFESVIMDLQRNYFLAIPNLLYEILITSKGNNYSIEALKKHYGNEYNDGIDAYFNLLLSHGLGIYTNNVHLYPELNKEFHSPYRLISSSLNFTDNSEYDLKNTLRQLSKLGCQLIQIRIFGRVDLTKLEEDLNMLNGSRTKIIELYFEDYKYNESHLLKIIENNMRVSIVVHSASEQKDKTKSKNSADRCVHYITKRLKIRPIEIYSIDTMTCNIEVYIEALRHNVGLNRKITVDEFGNIKNYLSHDRVYGNINYNALDEIIDNKDFQETWTIGNDLIEKCKDCQYRYACLSNSDIEYRNKKYYKKDDCGFNPYANSWSNEKKNTSTIV